MIPWKFFDLTARDQTGVLLLGIHRVVTKSQAALDITQEVFSVPAENAFLLTSYSIEAEGNAGAPFSAPLSIEFQVRDASGNVVSALVDTPATVWLSPAATSLLMGKTLCASPILVVGPGMRLFQRAKFSGANPANHIQCGINGVLIPRGTMAYQT